MNLLAAFKTLPSCSFQDPYAKKNTMQFTFKISSNMNLSRSHQGPYMPRKYHTFHIMKNISHISANAK